MTNLLSAPYSHSNIMINLHNKNCKKGYKIAKTLLWIKHEMASNVSESGGTRPKTNQTKMRNNHSENEDVIIKGISKKGSEQEDDYHYNNNNNNMDIYIAPNQ